MASVHDPVTMTVTLAVMEYRPPCCEYTLINVDIRPASALRVSTLQKCSRSVSHLRLLYFGG